MSSRTGSAAPRLLAFACAASAFVAGAARAGVSDPPARGLLLELTKEPRLAGTVGSLVGAELVARWLCDAGWRVEIETRLVLLSLPRRIEFQIFEGAGASKPEQQRIERFDPDAIPPGDLPLCNGWSASGDVRGAVVDAGRALRADFERLKSAGVDLKGTIALARYGGCYRGIKVDLATQFGCAGILLFEERTKEGEVWPAGPWKPGHEAQRGSISPMARTPGDPSTPGWPSPKPGESAKRLTPAELDEALPKIPCIPIGWAEAEEILARLAPRETTDKDGKPATRPTGPGPCEVRLVVDQPRDIRPIHNVIATLAGESEDCVIAGAHRDAWVRGANDDGSGVVCMVRAAQLLGARAKGDPKRLRSATVGATSDAYRGWKPKHTIVIALWDAEEFGMIGSTEWAEAHADWIRRQCFAYVNSDTGCQGTHFRGASGTPGMLGVLRRALERVPTPEPREEGDPKTLWEDWKSSLKGKEPEIEPAGSGSDFAVFLHHLSKPVVDISLSGNRGGQYHTAFDDFPIVDRYLDPGFVGHEMCARLLAELLGQLADEGPDAFDLMEALHGLRGIAEKAGKETDPGAGKPWLGAERAARIVGAFFAMTDAPDDGAPPAPRLYDALALENGIPGREWYKNPIWAPGLEDGYGSELFPGLHARARLGELELDRAVDELVKRIESTRYAYDGAPGARFR